MTDNDNIKKEVLNRLMKKLTLVGKTDKATLLSFYPVQLESILNDYFDEAIQKACSDLLPSEKCNYCGGKLNIWTGSHTCVRIQTSNRVLRWICTNCYDRRWGFK